MTTTDRPLESEREATARPVAVTLDAARSTTLTQAQYLMWLGQQIDPDVPLYNMIYAFRISGAVDQAAFDQAWRGVVERSDALRTIVRVRHGEPAAAVRRSIDIGPDIVDLRDDADPEAALRAWIDARRTRIFDLTDRLWDTALLQLDDDTFVWYLAQHHAICDARSNAIVFDTVANLYELALVGRLDEASDLPQFADHIEHEAEVRTTPGFEAATAHWASRVADPVPPTRLYGSSTTGGSAATERIPLDLGAERSAALRDIATRKPFASLSTDLALHGIWATLVATFLHRVAGADRVRVGSPFGARPAGPARDTIGPFIEIGTLDAAIDHDATFGTVAKSFQRELMLGLRHAKAGISSPVVNGSYDVLLNVLTDRFDRFAGLDVETDWIHSGAGDRDHLLRVQVTDFGADSAFRLLLDADADALDATQRSWLVAQFERLVDRFIEDPTRPLGSFHLLDDDEHRRFVEEFNAEGPGRAARRSDATTVVDRIRRRCADDPDGIVLREADRSISARDFDERTDRLAAHLSDVGVTPGSRVAICLPRSVEAVEAIVGTMKAGAAFVPVDLSNPPARRRAMLDDAAPAAVVCLADAADEFATGPVPIVEIDRLGPAPGSPVSEPGVTAPAPDDVAYVIYTSGSTGTPKGTMIPHRALTNYVSFAADEYDGGQGAAFALHSSLSFDLTITSLFTPLVTGGEIVVYPETEHGSGLAILDVLGDDAVDVVKLTPAHLDLIRQDGFPDSSRLRCLIVGGENFRTELARDVAAALDGVEIINEYGPTEATVGCMIHRFDAESDTGPSVPIGRPTAGMSIHVIDTYGQPVPSGVIGEMVVGGIGVADGYLDRPELTAERFGRHLADPTTSALPDAPTYRTGDLARWGSDGRLEFLGRNDHQVKIRGHRIEVGEVEAALVEIDGIETAVVDVVVDAVHEHLELKHCVRCGLPSNYPGSEFDEHDVCADCRAYEIHRDDVARYFRTPADLQREIDAVRQRSTGAYDCVVLVSGGKDSTYMLYQLVREYRLRPLVFTLDHGYIADAALDNVRNACEDLGVDLHVGTSPHMNAIFVDSLERHANVCDGCFKTIYTLSMALARDLGIPSIVTGLARGQLFETRLADTFAVREFDPDTIDDWIKQARQAYHHIDDAVYQLLDRDLFNSDEAFDAVEFIDFYRYVDVGLDEVYRYLVEETTWTRPPDTGRSTNCLINDVGIHVHNTTRGYHNYALPYSWDVRLGHKHRAAAMDELDDDIDLERVRTILDEIGHTDPIPVAHGDARLVGYYVADAEVSASDIRERLQASLPSYMVPAYLLRLDSVPLTANGKVDRAALPGPTSARPELSTPYAAPTNDVERALVEVWTEVFQLPDIGVADNFFDLGGDSITSIRVVAEARRRGIAITARDIFSGGTISVVAASAVVRSDQAENTWAEPVAGTRIFVPGSLPDDVVAAGAAALAAVGGWDAITDAFPLTPTQEGMLYHCLREDDPTTYVAQATCSFPADIDVDRLRSEFAAATERHPAMRTRLIWSGLEQPHQLVLREVEHDWSVHDARGGDAVDTWRTVLADGRDTGVAVGSSTLMNFAVVIGDDAVRLVWNAHHISLDGWSAQLVFAEVVEAIRGRKQAPVDTPAASFSDFVAWQRSQDRDAAVSYWTDTLGSVDAATALAFIDEASTADGTGVTEATVSIEFDEQLTADLATFVQHQHLTIGSVVPAAWALVLAHYSSETDVVVGRTVSGRSNGPDGVDRTVGMLLETLPMRVEIDPRRSVGDWLRQVQDDAATAQAHGHVGLAEIQSVVAGLAGAPLFDTIVVIENQPAGGDVRLDVENPSNFALALLVHPGERLRIDAVYDESRIDAADAERILGHLRHAIISVAVDGERTVGEVEILTPDEVEMLRRWGLGDAAHVPSTGIHEQIAAHATLTPDAVAVVGADRALTYDRLDRGANRLAHALIARGVRRGHCVGVVTGDDTQLVAAILAILKAGATYVPMDRELPTSRLAAMVEQTGATIVVGVDGFEPFEDLGVDLFDVRAFDDSGFADTAPDIEIAVDDPAYVVFTSGSTGRPKGVVVDHGNIGASTAARSSFYGESVSTFLLLSSLAFDSSMVGLFWTLCDGGTLVMPPLEDRHQPAALGALIERHDVSHVLALPSLYGLLLDEVDGERLRSLRTVIVAGEACPRPLVEQHVTQLPDTSLVNEYGPTEGTVWSHATRLDVDLVADGVPIGRPIPNSTCHVVDRFGHPTPVGIAGELVLGGPGIAVGYLDRPDLTDAAFVTMPHLEPGRLYRTGDLVAWRDDGLLDFVGRVDRQVKVRGHRIELGDVEASLTEHPDVVEVAVDVDGGAAGSDDRRRLVGWYVADQVIDEAAWRTDLDGRLPSYMVPTVLVAIDEMPRTPNGKVDRDALTVPEPIVVTRAAAGQPANEAEATLLGIWRDVLRRDDIGVDDDFFDLGGNSLDAMRMFARIERDSGRRVPLRALFSAPTVALLADELESTSEIGVSGSLVPIKPTGHKKPFFYVPPYQVSVLVFGEIAREFDPERPFYGLQASGLEEGEVVHRTVEEIAAHMIAQIKSRQPAGPYLLGGHCDGTWIAHEIAVQLADRDETVSYLALTDLPPPSEEFESANTAERLFDRAKHYVGKGDLWNAIKWKALSLYEQQIAFRFGGPEGQRVRTVRAATAAAYGAYDFRHDDRARIHLLRSTELVDEMERIDWYDALRLDDGRVTDIDATHKGLTTGEEASLLAQVLCDTMDEFED